MSTVIRGLFFDMDGTLADTHEANGRAYQQALAEAGYTVPLADVQAAVASGRGSSDFVPDLAPGITPDQLAGVLAAKQRLYDGLQAYVRYNHELINFLKVMRGGHTTVLVTHAKRANAAIILRNGGLEDLFDHLVVFEDVGTHKPDPGGYHKALALTGLKPGEVIAFEDSEHGVQAAQAAGITVIKVDMNHAV